MHDLDQKNKWRWNFRKDSGMLGEGYYYNNGGNGRIDVQTRSKNHNFQALKKITTTIFLTNFPEEVHEIDLRKRCEDWGNVADVFISKRLTKMGRRFRIVRFLKVTDVHLLVSNLRTIWFGNYHVFADLLKDDRHLGNHHDHGTLHTGTTVGDGKVAATRIERDISNPSTAHKPYYVNEALSYVSAVKGKPNYKKDEGQSKEIMKHKTMQLNNGDMLGIADSSCNVLVKVVDIHSMEKIMVWIELEGIPLCAWSINAFRKIAGTWGSCMFVDEDSDESLGVGRVCVLTNQLSLIHDSISVNIDGETFHVQTREGGGWAPKFIRSFVDVESDESDMETDVNDEDPNVPDKGVIDTMGENTINVFNEGEDRVEGESLSTPPGFDGRIFVDVNGSVDRPSGGSPMLKQTKRGGVEVLVEKAVDKCFRKQSSADKSPVSLGSSSFKNRKAKLKQKGNKYHGGSLINNILRNTEVANVLGYDMLGSKEDLANLLKRKSESMVDR
ncbi:hypothetical protein L1987_13192 [Smallanthus sonchifolius]|uniref:Uncharacterized protein n=1 Tax=Smallanthus sonchifolius TaxID=185202 RepID=A0ACB9JI82_9ASTR|nr:hypothetical protein L1987_13192 [Smallanthus sonchifolius]